jgi:hypothetical protein
MGFEECGIINGINDGGIGEVFFRKYLWWMPLLTFYNERGTDVPFYDH